MIKSEIFRLTAAILAASCATAALADKEASTKAGTKAPSEMVCKKFAVTGSLISSRRICKTPAEWRMDEERIRQMNENNTCTSNFNSGCSG